VTKTALEFQLEVNGFYIGLPGSLGLDGVASGMTITDLANGAQSSVQNPELRNSLLQTKKVELLLKFSKSLRMAKLTCTLEDET
jgi:hypothetical protein